MIPKLAPCFTLIYPDAMPSKLALSDASGIHETAKSIVHGQSIPCLFSLASQVSTDQNNHPAIDFQCVPLRCYFARYVLPICGEFFATSNGNLRCRVGVQCRRRSEFSNMPVPLLPKDSDGHYWRAGDHHLQNPPSPR